MSNINGDNIIVGKPEHKGVRVIDTYSRTPVIDPDLVPRGRYMHIGSGVWLHRCAACDDYMLTYGTIGYVLEFAQHEYAHGIDVPGYNVPMMA